VAGTATARRVAATVPPIIRPSAAAAATSVGKWRPVDSRDQLTAQANAPTGTAITGAAELAATV
jgi:hypothetical protein